MSGNWDRSGREMKSGTRQARTARKRLEQIRFTLVSGVWERNGRKMRSGTRLARTERTNKLNKHSFYTRVESLGQ